MPEERVMLVEQLPLGAMRVVNASGTEILLVHHERGYAAVQPKCPHAGAPLEEGAVCRDRLVCPWHLGTFALPTGELLEPPPMVSLKTYRLRVHDGSIFVDPDEAGQACIPVKQSAEKPLFLIVGGGAAGTMAAVTLRQHGFAGKIVVVEPNAEEPVDRTQLSKDALGGKMPLDEIGMDALSQIDVEVVRDRVVEFSAADQQAKLSKGRVISFDKAFVATGGSPKRLKIAGAELAYTIRHAQDVAKIQEAAKGKRSVAIVGTSFIGMEAASALVQNGLDVTVVGEEALPFSKQFGDRIAKSLMSLHENNGTKFRLGVQVERIESDGLVMREGNASEKIAAELVIFGVGVTPELSFQHDLSLAEDGGVKTDAGLQSGASVWVGGDIANVSGTRIEHWRVAQQHGRAAALSMLDKRSRYEGVPYFWTYHFGKRIGYLGHANHWDELSVQGDLDELEFIALYVEAGRVKAVLNCGYESQMAGLAELMRDSLTKDDALQAIRTRPSQMPS